MFVTPAFAQAGTPAPGGGVIELLFPLILVVGIMYLLVYRPQRRQMREREAMLNAVKRGDTVVTGGGLVGKVTSVHDAEGEVDIDLGGGTKVRALRAMLADVRGKDGKSVKGAPAKAAEKPEAANEDAAPKVKSRTRR